MTIRRQWLVVLTVTAILAVCINTIILSSLINRYFLSYRADAYQHHVDQIEQLAIRALTDHSLTEQQLSVQLESHLDDPILSIKLYDTDGNLIAGAGTADGMTGMMNSMMSRMMRNNPAEVDSVQLTDGDTVLGELHITRYSTLNRSLASAMFQAALIRNSIVSFIIVLIVLLFIGLFTSTRLSRDLRNTASLALGVDVGDAIAYHPSKVREIRVIQSALEALGSRLKLRQVARKQMVDEFVHQTRTPLTILTTHLEGLEDGVIAMSEEEINVCRSQVDHLSSIISNTGMLLDADRPTDVIHKEEVELSALLDQIVGGLKVQFEKKQIALGLLSRQPTSLTTDKHKLSLCIYNLLTNAYKFTEPGGSVTLSYEGSDEGIIIRVHDTGIGIPPEDLPHLFDPYFRGYNGAAAAGDGLGLFMVRENLNQLGGTVSVRSQPGTGSEFTIELPATA